MKTDIKDPFLLPALIAGVGLILAGAGAHSTKPSLILTGTRFSKHTRILSLLYMVALLPFASVAENLVQNPGFETGETSGWSPLGSVIISAQTAQVHSGRYAALIQNRTETWHGIVQSLQGVIEPGTPYNISGWVRLSSGAAQTFKMTMYKLDANGDKWTSLASSMATTSGWTQLAGQYNLSVSGALSELILFFEMPSSSTADFYVDDVSVTPPLIATTGPLTSIRAGHSATLLRNGTVLVVGGFNGTIRLATSELYNPAAGAWSPSGKMAIGRTLHTATLLSNGRVLVTGGHFTATGSSPTCELYDPVLGTWTETGQMATARGNHTATLLLNGKVLVAGGFNRNTASVVSTAELYDPGTGTWRTVGWLAQARENHTATLLLNGKVLVAGGAPDNSQFISLSSVEVYDPDAGSWTTNNPMSSARQFHTANLLPDGRVLVAGGGDVGYFTSSAEIYDPASGTWTATGPLGTSRGVHSATLLPNGKVLTVGGRHNSLDAPTLVDLFRAELYDPAAGTWTRASRSLNAARSLHTATLLPNGQVLVAAGFDVNKNVWLSSAELYDSTAGPITLIHSKKLPGGAFQFAFTGVPNRTNTMLATTDLALPLTNWTKLGVVPEFAPGLFLFTDPQATNHSQRVYRVRSP